MILQGENNHVFRSNGKLMLTGEYAVLKGAESLSLPLRKGQTMKVSVRQGIPSVHWKTYILGSLWFEARYSIPDFAIANTNDFPTAQFIRSLLLAVRRLQSSFLMKKQLYLVVNDLEFEPQWGFGSSSSLITNMARWAGIDPFELHFLVSEGSGYDVATADSEIPLLYRLENRMPMIRKVRFDPPFKRHLFFVYSGKKISTAGEVRRFNLQNGRGEELIGEISRISRQILRTTDFIDFVRLLNRHEEIVSSIIGKKPLGKSLYRDFKGAVKSLGAWGGDFMLLACDYPKEYVMSYLKKRDLRTWFDYEDLIVCPKSGIYDGAETTE